MIHHVFVSSLNIHDYFQPGYRPITKYQWQTDGANNTSQQYFGTRKVYCVSNVTFHTETKYEIKIFPSPTVFVQWPF